MTFGEGCCDFVALVTTEKTEFNRNTSFFYRLYFNLLFFIMLLVVLVDVDLKQFLYVI